MSSTHQLQIITDLSTTISPRSAKTRLIQLFDDSIKHAKISSCRDWLNEHTSCRELTNQAIDALISITLALLTVDDATDIDMFALDGNITAKPFG